MSPQPLTDFPSARLFSGAAYVIKNYPSIPPVVAQHIVACSIIDYVWSGFLMTSLRENAAFVIDLLEEVTSPGARDAVLRKALNRTFGQENTDHILTIWDKRVASAKGTRNAYAHGLWNASPDLKNCLIILDTRVLIPAGAEELRATLKSGEVDPDDDTVSRLAGSVYTLEEMERLLADAEACARTGFELLSATSFHGDELTRRLHELRARLGIPPKKPPRSEQTPPSPPPRPPGEASPPPP